MKSDQPTTDKRTRRPSYLVVLLLLLLIFPVFIAQAWFYVRYAEDALQAEQSRTLSRARTLAVVVERDFTADVVLLQAVAERQRLREALERRDWSALDEHLADAGRYQPEFLFVSVFDTAGNAQRAVPDDPFVGKNFAFRDWFRGVTAKWEPYISEVYRTQMRTRELVVAVATPIRNERKQPIGILMAAVSLQRLARAVERTQYGVVGEPYIVDQRGNVVAPVDPRATEPQAAPEADSVRRALAGQEVNQRTGRGSDGWVLSATPIPVAGWAVIYRRPVNVALANVVAVRRDMTTTYTYVLLVFLASAGVVHWQVRRQRRMHDALEESEERHRLLFQQGPQPMWVFDTETLRFLDVNNAAIGHYGYSREEFLSMSVKDIRPAEDVPRLLKDISALKDKSHSRNEWRHLKKDGSLIIVEVHAHHINHAGRAASLAVVNDVTEQKRAEAALQAARKQLQDLLDGMTTMVAMVGVDGRFIKVNQIAQVASGMSPEELMKTPYLEGPWWKFDPEVQARVRAAFQRACAGETINYEERLFVFGKVITINFSMTPVAGPDGRVEYIVTEGRDVTPLKEAEQALHARTLQLEAANHELEAFTYSVSHDLRAPLRHISGFASIIQEDHADKLPADAKSHFARITQAAAHMGRLIDDLLNLARVGRKELTRQPVELNSLVQAAMGDVEREAAGRAVEWKIAPLPLVSCDPGLTRQIYVNLLSNSLKYSRPRAKAVIEVGQARVNGDAALFVRDNGVGFDMKYAHKLFGVFQRLHRVEDFEGTGVGLATVQRIVNKHGGKIWAEAELDKGATFYFTLGE